ncbi:MAG: SRPBCC family protein [Chthoniobacterales bacterium]
MTYARCPTTVVNAPIDIVWMLLTEPAGWGDFFDVRISGVEPTGSAVVGQRFYGESGWRFLNFRLKFEYTEVNPAQHKLGLNVQLPFGIIVREDLHCISLSNTQSRVSYHCDFGFPNGWRGTIARVVMHRELDAGPADHYPV